MGKFPKFSPEVVERAVRMVLEAKDQYPSQWAAIESVAAKIGCTAETLRRWVRQGERDQGLRERCKRCLKALLTVEPRGGTTAGRSHHR